MKLQPMPMLLLLLLTSPSVAIDPRIRGSTHMPRQISTFVQIQQVKERILQGLNMTNPPQTPPTTRMLPLEQWFRRQKAQFQESLVEQKITPIMILSEAADSQKLDMMNFKIDSRLRDSIARIKTAVLVVRLRSQKRTSDGSKARPSKRTKSIAGLKRSTQNSNELPSSQGSPTIARGLGRNNSSSSDKDKANNKNTETSTTFKIRHKNKKARAEAPEVKRRKSKNSKKRNRTKHRKQSKARRVKVVIRVLDKSTKRMRRIAVKRINVKKTTTMPVSLPIELLREAAASVNHTLTLQISCKRCQGRVQLDKVFKIRGKKRKNSPWRRLNPNRPYLFIKQRDADTTNSTDGTDRTHDTTDTAKRRRYRRTVNSDCPEDIDYDVQISLENGQQTFTPIYKGQCCMERTYITFKELGLSHFIIYPDGFSTLFCKGSCIKDTLATKAVDAHSHKFSPSRVKSVHSDTSRGQIRSDENGGQRPMLPHSDGKECGPVRTTALDLLYLDLDRNSSYKIIPGRIEDFIVDACGCMS